MNKPTVPSQEEPVFGRAQPPGAWMPVVAEGRGATEVPTASSQNVAMETLHEASLKELFDHFFRVVSAGT